MEWLNIKLDATTPEGVRYPRQVTSYWGAKVKADSFGKEEENSRHCITAHMARRPSKMHDSMLGQLNPPM